MPLKLFNTLSGKVEEFVPLQAGEATFYSCGPTVYDYAHIGNFRSFLAADVLRRWLESPLGPGLKVRQVMNITDVGHMVDDSAADGGGEDKMEEARRRLQQDKKSGKLPADVAARIDATSPTAIADYYAACFIEDARLLGLRVVADADKAVADAGGNEAARDKVMPRPTRMVREMLEMIVELLARGHAYQVGGAVYFDTQTFPDYGKLSGNTLDKIRSGAGGRVSATAQAAKKHPADFMLWKGDKTHLMRWDPSAVLGRKTDLPEGYPGWHIECSAMAKARLGEVIDLHSGGEDNIFPHHECEIAQSRCANGARGHEPAAFSRYWFHPRFLQVEGAKMSKSKGNFFTLRDLVAKGFSPSAIRLELIKTHYRSNANFTEQGLKDSERRINRWWYFTNAVGLSGEMPGAAALVERTLEEFSNALNDDLNIAAAIAAIDKIVSSVTPADVTAAMQDSTHVRKVAVAGNRPASPEEALKRFDAQQEAIKLDQGRAFVAAMARMDQVLGVIFTPKAPMEIASAEADAQIDDLVRRRTEARAQKNWAESDRIRDELAALNIVVTDSPSGPKWSRKAAL